MSTAALTIVEQVVSEADQTEQVNATVEKLKDLVARSETAGPLTAEMVVEAYRSTGIRPKTGTWYNEYVVSRDPEGRSKVTQGMGCAMGVLAKALGYGGGAFGDDSDAFVREKLNISRAMNVGIILGFDDTSNQYENPLSLRHVYRQHGDNLDGIRRSLGSFRDYAAGYRIGAETRQQVFNDPSFNPA